MSDHRRLCDTLPQKVKMLAEAGHDVAEILEKLKEEGLPAKRVDDGIYPVGIQVGTTTVFVPALQPKTAGP